MTWFSLSAVIFIGLIGALSALSAAAEETVNELINAAYEGTDPSLTLSREPSDQR